ncbi:agmatine deiminase family protein [Undibacterium sp. RuTC16W]|uniref:agmatine deiminase family protein n=1 Tax=Undibacterium sp. RuTC16W TaxID=3413048 RepID=UPI003BF2181D
MPDRRVILKKGLLATQTLLLSTAVNSLVSKPLMAATQTWRMPDEAEPHAASWMAFGPSESIWGKDLLTGAQDNLALIARSIASFEPVKMLVREADYAIARRKCGSAVQLLAQEIDDLWMRDTGPLFVTNGQGKLAGVNFNFNGWGEKQDYARDANVASFLTSQLGVPSLSSKLVLEGGGIEVDGAGTAIISESCVLNANRNPHTSKAQCEIELKSILGLKKIIWLPGIAGKDITDGHTDFYARFTSLGVVVVGLDADTSSYDHAVCMQNIAILRRATDALGRQLRVIILPAPASIRPKYESKEFAAGYINFYICNGVVIAPEFGDIKSDRNARDLLREQFPKREIIQLNIDAIAAGGGGIHCTTQQQPRT